MSAQENSRSYGHGAAGDLASHSDRAKVSVRTKMRYRFDNSLSKGPGAFIGWIGLIAVSLALILTVIRVALDGLEEGTNFIDKLWNTFYIMFIGGASAAPAATWVDRAIAIVFWAMAISVTATIIGFVSTFIAGRLEQLRKGLSPIIEAEHTLILGWSNRIFPILQQLSVANENVPNPLVVIFANENREMMDDEIASRAGDLGNTRIVTRRGDTTNPRDLERANIDGAGSIIILDSDETGDANVVATVLAVKAVSNNKNKTIVAELDNADNARTLAHATNGQVRTVRSHDVIARVTAQASRQPGLAAVVLDLLDFEGDEIYFGSTDELTGHTYSEAVLAFEKSAVIGLQNADGSVVINPAADTTIKSGDKVIAIAADDDQVNFSGLRDDLKSLVDSNKGYAQPEREAEHILAIGWSEMGRAVLTELASFLPKGSSVHVVTRPEFVDQDTLAGLTLGDIHVSFSTVSGNIHDLISIASAKHYNEVIVLGYREGISQAEADAMTMLTMLQMNQLFEEDGNGVSPTRLVAEILDSRKAELARVASADDLVVSDNLAALMIAQISENPALSPVFTDLFDADGASINVKPIEHYTTVGATHTFAELVAIASAHGESAIGYRKALHDRQDPTSGVVLNPAKSESITVASGDGLVVIGDID